MKIDICALVMNAEWEHFKKGYDSTINDSNCLYTKVMKSIRKEGVRTPILIDSNNKVLDGNLRIACCMHLQIKEIPYGNVST
jgi:hypothetical protein